jgi:hypothetical protein
MFCIQKFFPENLAFFLDNVKKYDTFRQGTDGNTKHAIYMLNN